MPSDSQDFASDKRELLILCAQIGPQIRPRTGYDDSHEERGQRYGRHPRHHRDHPGAEGAAKVPLLDKCLRRNGAGFDGLRL
jgi:hypothetical protein